MWPNLGPTIEIKFLKVRPSLDWRGGGRNADTSKDPVAWPKGNKFALKQLRQHFGRGHSHVMKFQPNWSSSFNPTGLNLINWILMWPNLGPTIEMKFLKVRSSLDWRRETGRPKWGHTRGPCGPPLPQEFPLPNSTPAGMAKREQICPKMAKMAHISNCDTLA